VEESTIAHLTPKEVMSDIFAWYSLIGTAGTALGMLVCGWIMSFLQESKGWDFVAACRVIFFVYAAIGAIKFMLTLGLTSNVEAAAKKKKENRPPSGQQEPSERQPLLATDAHPDEENEVPKPKQRKIPFLPDIEAHLVGLVVNLCFLFALDSFASGLASL
jgi:MFS family permease